MRFFKSTPKYRVMTTKYPQVFNIEKKDLIGWVYEDVVGGLDEAIKRAKYLQEYGPHVPKQLWP